MKTHVEKILREIDMEPEVAKVEILNVNETNNPETMQVRPVKNHV